MVAHLLERAAAGDQPLERLLEAWAQHPAPAIAEVIERVPRPELAEVITGTAIEGSARLDRLDARPDPRVTSALVSWLLAPPWHATAAKPFYAKVVARLRALADPRTPGLLAQASRAIGRKVKGATMRGWLIAEVAALRADRPAVPVLRRQDKPLLTRAARALARQPVTARPASRRTDAAAELLAAIYAHPGDDAARQVYADLLLEQQDPRGTFIAMQLARAGREPTPAERRAELALLGTHVRTWMAELAGVVSLTRATLDVGPDGGLNLTFERGFPSRLVLKGSANKLAAIATHPGLSTVEVLAMWDHGEVVLAKAPLPALRRFDGGTPAMAALSGHPRAAHLEELVLAERPSHPLAAALVWCERLTALRTLAIYLASEEVLPALRDALRDVLRHPRLETVKVAWRGRYLRSDGRWRFEAEAGADTAVFASVLKR